MQRKGRVERLADEAAGQLLRLLIHPSLGSVELLGSPLEHRVDTACQTAARPVELHLGASAGRSCFSPETVLRRRVLSVEARLYELNTELGTVTSRMPCFSVAPSSVLPVHYGSIFGTVSCQDVAIRPSMQFCDRHVRIESAHSAVLRLDPLSPAVQKQATVALRISTYRNVNLISKLPIVIPAASWSMLGRDLIVAFWELLRRQAAEEIGCEPGRDLEMVAAFPRVSLRGISRTSFDPHKRELHLYPRAPGQRLNGHPVPCAIIIGTLRKSGRFITVIRQSRA